jgi:hypothetical protein
MSLLGNLQSPQTESMNVVDSRQFAGARPSVSLESGMLSRRLMQLTFLVAPLAGWLGLHAPASADVIKPNVGPEMFFDARRSSFTRDGNRQLFEGDVIAIGGGNLISADSVAVDQAKGVIEATGHVLLVSGTQIFSGTALFLQMPSGDFKLENALMIARDEAETAKVMNRVLGFSPSEVEFEAARRRRLEEIGRRKDDLRNAARESTRGSGDLDPVVVDSYARLLEQEELTRLQENPTLARLNPQKRATLKSRREYWEKGREKSLPDIVPQTWYFRMEGTSIERNAGNDYRAREAMFTPCRCDENESPDWSFRADTIEAQLGGYADLWHAVLQINDVPVLYLPWIKLPIKDQRQSGFLLPQLGFDSRSGNILSQPVFFDLSPSSDMTVTADIFERRGTRLGVEWRHEQRRNSGWTLGVEGMRDSLWMQERASRQIYSDLYGNGVRRARDASATENVVTTEDPVDATRRELQSRAWWEANASDCVNSDPEAQARCDAFLRNQLAPPSNTWRGSFRWRGQTWLAPRLMFVSKGDIVSDHRYSEELRLAQDWEEALFSGPRMPAYNRARGQLHLGADEFYLGVGSFWGDNVRLPERFAGLQMPVRATVQSRLARVTPSHWRWLQLYAQASVEQVQVSDEELPDGLSVSEGRLGEGTWRRGQLKLTAPILGRGAVKMDHFTDLELRNADPAGFETDTTIQALRTGLRFQLPLDGRAEIPKWLWGKGESNWLHHLMNWSVTFAARPTVIRRGPYGGEIDGSVTMNDPTEGQTWFLSDSSSLASRDEDQDVPWEMRLVPSQTISFETSHRWRLVSRAWDLRPADERPQETTPPRESARERARRELLWSLDRPVAGVEDMFDGPRWFVNRWRLVDSMVAEPLQFGAGISYDFLKAKRRREEIQKSVDNRPWSEPSSRLVATWAGWSLGSEVTYNIYEKTAKSAVFNLAMPEIFKTAVQLGYIIEKQVLINSEQDASFRLTRTRSVVLNSGLIPAITTTVGLARRTKDEQTPPERYETRIGLSYADRSGCWGLRFLRVKEFDKEELDASYLLQLQITFMGQTRELRDMSPQVTRASGAGRT